MEIAICEHRVFYSPNVFLAIHIVSHLPRKLKDGWRPASQNLASALLDMFKRTTPRLVKIYAPLSYRHIKTKVPATTFIQKSQKHKKKKKICTNVAILHRSKTWCKIN